MNLGEWKIILARVFSFSALGCGITALVLGFLDGRVWNIGVLGWFSGGILLALLAIFLVIYDYIEFRSSRP